MSYEQLISDVVKGVEAVGAAIMVVGGLGSFVVFALHARRSSGAPAGSYEALRRNLGRSILLGLEVLIIADIVRTIIVDPTLDSVAVLGVIVVIRILLSFSLEVEMDGAWPWRRALLARAPRDPEPRHARFRPVSATIIDGKAVAARVRAEVAEEVAAFAARHGRPPGLATVLVGDDAASAVYVGGKQKASAEVGIQGFRHDLPADTTREDLIALIEQLNADDAVSGVLVQLPLPDHLDGVEVTGLVDPLKDVDGLTALSAGLLSLGREGLRPCTPEGVMLLLEEAGTALEGAEAVVIGRSNLFGKPMAQLLLGANATVTVAHSRTRDLPAVCRGADVLIAAVGRARMVEADWVKPGATVIDVGMNRVDGVLCGDVDTEAVAAVAGAITPVPGGVGPMTIACLLRNTLKAARLQAGDPA